MQLDLQWMGYGAGLVMVGWFSGMVVSVAMSGMKNLRG